MTSITRQSPTTSPTNADSLTWRITFDEDVENVDAADFGVDRHDGAAGGERGDGLDGVRRDRVGGQPGEPERHGDAVVSRVPKNITDTADTALANTTPTGTNDNSYEVDNTAPTVGITGVPAASSAPFTATFTFSEAVTGFVVGRHRGGQRRGLGVHAD